MSDKEKIKAAVSKLRRKDPRVIAIRNMIALAKAKGTPGEKGLDGIRGADGINGINGKDGIDGMRGADGMHGAKGLDGLKGEIGAVGPQGEKGEAGMIWRGTYRNDIEYDIGDVVGVSGSAYVCIAPTNQAPPVGFGWELLVSRGAQGVRGIKGEAGSGNIVEAVRHMRTVMSEMRKIQTMGKEELMAEAKNLGAPLERVANRADPANRAFGTRP